MVAEGKAEAIPAVPRSARSMGHQSNNTASSRRSSAAARKPSQPPKPVDINSPEYKAAARKYTSLMVAIPILLVTSYYLYERLVLGIAPKDVKDLKSPPPSEAKSLESGNTSR